MFSEKKKTDGTFNGYIHRFIPPSKQSLLCAGEQKAKPAKRPPLIILNGEELETFFLDCMEHLGLQLLALLGGVIDLFLHWDCVMQSSHM